jgi:uncharacterized membrane protein YoaK (UPF0700 family)
MSMAAGATRVTRSHIALILLSFSAGAADAFAFLALGGIFTANMTGNLILAGMFSRPDFWSTLAASLTAIVAFAGVLFAAFRLTRSGSPVARRSLLRRLIVPSIALQSVVVAVWIALPGTIGMPERFTVIALSAASLALQTVGAKKLSDVDGITTTYVTGTLTTTMQDLAEHRTGGQLVRLLSVIALPLGAVCATAALVLAPSSGPIVAWLAGVVATVILAVRRRPTRSA